MYLSAFHLNPMVSVASLQMLCVSLVFAANSTQNKTTSKRVRFQSTRSQDDQVSSNTSASSDQTFNSRLSYFTLSKNEYERIAETNKRFIPFICSYFTSVKLTICDFIQNFITTCFSEENLEKDRKLIDIWKYPLDDLLDGSDLVKQTHQFKHTESEDLNACLRAIELISSTRTCSRLFESGLKSESKDLNRLLTCVYTILKRESTAPNFLSTVNLLAKSVLYEILKILNEKIDPDLTFTPENVRVAIWSSELLPKNFDYLQLEYADYTGALHPYIQYFTFAETDMQFSCLDVTKKFGLMRLDWPDLIIQEIKLRNEEKMWPTDIRDSFINQDNYFVASIAFEDVEDVSKRIMIRYDREAQKYRDSRGKILTTHEFDALWEKHLKVSICYEIYSDFKQEVAAYMAYKGPKIRFSHF